MFVGGRQPVSASAAVEAEAQGPCRPGQPLAPALPDTRPRLHVSSKLGPAAGTRAEPRHPDGVGCTVHPVVQTVGRGPHGSGQWTPTGAQEHTDEKTRLRPPQDALRIFCLRSEMVASWSAGNCRTLDPETSEELMWSRQQTASTQGPYLGSLCPYIGTRPLFQPRGIDKHQHWAPRTGALAGQATTDWTKTSGSQVPRAQSSL